MKNHFSKLLSITSIIVFTIAISCSEQDDVVMNNPELSKNSKTTTARIGGDVFHSQVGGPLDLSTARQWTASFQSKHPDEIKSHFFGTEIIQKILNQSGTVGIRIYYALDEKGEKKLLLVGVDANGNSLLPKNTTNTRSQEEENTIADFSFPCPNICGGDGGL